MSVFTPDLCLSKVHQLDATLLSQYGIKGIILDVDNTLTAHDSQEVEQLVLDWIAEMKQAGIKLLIASNNSDDRIKPFATKIALDYHAMSCKPMTFAFHKAMQTFGLKASEVAVVGDQIYTDILGGNLKGMFTVLVEPYMIESGFLFRLKRKLERMHIKKYHRREKRRNQNV